MATRQFVYTPTGHSGVDRALRYLAQYLNQDIVPGVDSGITDADVVAQFLGVYFQPFDDDVHLTWTLHEGSVSNISYPNNGKTGGRTFRATGGETFIAANTRVAFEESWLYRFRCRVRMVVAPADPAKDLFSMGIEGVAADGSTIVGTDGTADYTKAHWIVAAAGDMGGFSLGAWQEFGGYFKGHGAPGSGVPSGDPTAPSQLHDNALYFRPVMWLNQDGGDGTMEVDYLAIDRVAVDPSDADDVEVLNPVIGVDAITRQAQTESLKVNAVTAAKTDLSGISPATGVIRSPLMRASAFHVGPDPKLEFLYTSEEITHSTFLLQSLRTGLFAKARVGDDDLFYALPHVAVIEREIRDDKVISIEVQDSADNPTFVVFPIPKWDPETIGMMMTTANPGTPFRTVLHSGRPQLIDAELRDDDGDWKYDLSYTASGATGSVAVVTFLNGTRVSRTLTNNAGGFLTPIYDTALAAGEILRVEITPFELPDGAGEKGDVFIRWAARSGGAQEQVTKADAYLSDEGEYSESRNMEVTVEYDTANVAGGDKVDIEEQINLGAWAPIITDQATGPQSVTVDLGEREYSTAGQPEVRRYRVILHDGASTIYYRRVTGQVDTRYALGGGTGGTGAGEHGGETGTMATAVAVRTQDGVCGTSVMYNTVSWTADDTEPGDTVSIDRSYDLDAAGFTEWEVVAAAVGLPAASGSYKDLVPGKTYQGSFPEHTLDAKYRVRLLNSSGVVKDALVTNTIVNDYDVCLASLIAIFAERFDDGQDSGTATKAQVNKLVYNTANLPAGATVEVYVVEDGGDPVLVEDALGGGDDIAIEQEQSGTVYDAGGEPKTIEYIVEVKDDSGNLLDSDSSGPIDNTFGRLVDPV
jgi:hypothetical protein